jgi:hypothetical protein
MASKRQSIAVWYGGTEIRAALNLSRDAQIQMSILCEREELQRLKLHRL